MSSDKVLPLQAPESKNPTSTLEWVYDAFRVVFPNETLRQVNIVNGDVINLLSVGENGTRSRTYRFERGDRQDLVKLFQQLPEVPNIP